MVGTELSKNRKAYFDYTIIDELVAGIVLVGSEVKSMRNKDVSIKEAFCHIEDGEVWLKGMHIAEFKESGKYQNHETIRDRKLLLNKKEIRKLEDRVVKKGMTIIPLKVILTTNGLIKIKIGLAIGKKQFDKRASIRDKDIKREIERSEKH